MSRFLWEPPTKLLLGDVKPHPRTALDLLSDLGVKSAPAAQQREAIFGWLAQNPPDDLMRVSLTKKGLPVSPLSVAEPSRDRARLMPGTVTIFTRTLWHSNVIFPKVRLAPTSSVNFAPVINHLLADADNDPTDDQPERRLDGVRVA